MGTLSLFWVAALGYFIVAVVVREGTLAADARVCTAARLVPVPQVALLKHLPVLAAQLALGLTLDLISILLLGE